MSSHCSCNARLDSAGHAAIVRHMKRRLQWIALVAVACSSTSCGLSQLLSRTVGNNAQKLTPLINAAAAAAY